MDCTTYDAWLLDLLDDRLALADALAARTHAQTCPVCRANTEDARRIRSAYAELPLDDVSAPLASDLLARARDLDGTSASATAPVAGLDGVIRRVALLAAAAALLLAATWLLPRSPDALGGHAPPSVAEQLRRGDAARDAGDVEAAMAAYTDALLSADDAVARASLHHRLAELHLRDARPQAALAELEQVLAGDGAYAQRDRALLQQAEALRVLGRLDESRAAFEALAGEYPEHEARVEAGLRALDEARDYDLRDLETLGYL